MNGSLEMQNIAIQSIADMLCAHKTLLAPTHPTSSDAKPHETDAAQPNQFVKPFTKSFIGCLKSKNPIVSQNTCLAICKLLLHDVFSPTMASDFIKHLTILYFDPDPETGDGPNERTKYRQTVSQTLSYCLPAYCHVRLSNALLMSQLAVPIMQKLVMMKEELDEVEQGEDMATWAVITGQFAEWTDPRRVWIDNIPPRDGAALPPAAEDPHVNLAIAILERVLSSSSSKEERKPLLLLLGKLNVASSTAFLAGEAKSQARKSEEDVEMLRTLHELAAEGVEAKIGPDARCREYVAKVEMVVGKKLGEKEDSEVTVRPSERASETPAVVDQSEAEVAEQAEQAGQEGEEVQAVEQEQQEDEEEEDTLLAGMHAEGTRMPLEEEDEDEDEDTTMNANGASTGDPTAGSRSRSIPTVTESDIVDSLLQSEME
jgi:condensin complex subunit 3